MELERQAAEHGPPEEWLKQRSTRQE